MSHVTCHSLRVPQHETSALLDPLATAGLRRGDRGGIYRYLMARAPLRAVCRGTRQRRPAVGRRRPTDLSGDRDAEPGALSNEQPRRRLEPAADDRAAAVAGARLADRRV